MEKTIQINIGGTQFQITEAAYDKLSRYLESLKAHFVNEADSAEIIRDIESRIAEKLLEQKSHLVNEADVTHVIEDIGSASQFESETTSDTSTQPTAKGVRKLYRDTDTAMIAGVASGLAAYFDVGVMWVRLAFIASIFFGGTGIVLYILLAIFVPAAKTASQKLEMRGDAVTLDSISRLVKERVDEATKSGVPERAVGLIRAIFLTLFRVVTKIFGLLLSLGAFFAVLGLTVVCAVTIANWNTPYVSSAIRDIASPTLFWSAITAGYLALVIPLVFISTLGSRLLRGKNVIPTGVGFGLVGVWCLAIIVSGAIATRVVGDYYAYTSTHPDYQEVSEERDVASFSSIDVRNSRVTVREAETQSVTVYGLRDSLNLVHASTQAGVLAVSTDEWTDTCIIFCRRSHPTVIITTPDIEAISIENGNLNIEKLSTPSADLRAKQSSVRIEFEAETLNLASERSSIRGDVESQKLTISGKDSHFDLEGTAYEADVSLLRSAFNTESLTVGALSISAVNSFARVNATSSITVTDDRSSNIVNDGEAGADR